MKLKGSMLGKHDVITIVAPTVQCGADGTENMDPALVKVPSGSSVPNLDRLGSARVFRLESRAADGQLVPEAQGNTMVWESWPIQTTDAVSGSVKVCYCSSATGPCKGKKRFNVSVGSVLVVGPSSSGLQLVSKSGGVFCTFPPACSARGGVVRLA